ncbi:MAG TPA: ImmA/IrrE family metallo-endopeptidase, partial [Candidatus Udaeobacter sp.]
AIKRDIREEGRKRFTVCHEVGHFILPGHGTTDCICLADEVESWRKNMPEQELAANQFAAELLLPYKEIQPFVRQKELTIALAKDISKEFRASLTAASLKCVEVTEEKCAVVFSVAGSIKWFRRNDNFQYFVRVNQKVSDESYAGQLFTNPYLDEPYGAVPANAWLESESLSSDARIWEDSILLPHYNSAITILTIHKQKS